MALVRLMSAGSHVEAQLVKGLLETEGIPCVVNGESRSTDMGTEAGFAEIIVLVNEEQLEQGRLLLEAKVVAETPEKPGEIPEGAVCPVHELQATKVCSRCGSFLCAGCGQLGVPPICEACNAVLSDAPRPRTKTKAIAWVVLVFLLGIPLVGVAILRLFFGGY
jgi:hypothetical protein